MINFLLRISVVLFIIFLQINFFNLIFLQDQSINLAMLMIISWIIIRGFEKMWLWVVILGFLSDIFLGGRVGIHVVFFILFAYFISFISRRFIIERRFSGFALVMIFILVGNFIFSLLDLFLKSNDFLGEAGIYIKNYFGQGGKFFLASILSGILFYLIYNLVSKVERYIAQNESRLKIPFN